MYYPLGKALEKQTEKQVDALKSLTLSSETDESKWIKSLVPKNLLNDLKQMNYIINQVAKKLITLVNIIYLLFFKRYT